MRTACMPDIKSFCADVEPGGGKIMQCLKDHKAQLSDACKSAAAELRMDRRSEKNSPK